MLLLPAGYSGAGQFHARFQREMGLRGGLAAAVQHDGCTGMDEYPQKALAEKTAGHPVFDGVCAVFSPVGDGSMRYAIGQIDGDLRQFIKDMNGELNGRGGGKPFFAQGSIMAKEDQVKEFFSARNIKELME